MALLLAPQPVGAIIDIRGQRVSTLKVTAPDGLELRIPAPNGKVTLWLPQPGEWTYTWTDGTTGTITVLADAPARTPPPAPRRPRPQPTPTRWA